MKILLTLASAFLLNGFVNSASLVIEGKYQNKNVFVQNAIGNSGVGFCAQEIKVNGKIRIFLVSVETQQIYLIAKALILASFYSDLHTSYTMHSREIK